MATIHIGIGHDDELVVTELGKVKRFWILCGTNFYAKSSEHVADLFVVVDPVFHRLFNVEDFTPEWQDGLKVPVAALLGSSSC